MRRRASDRRIIEVARKLAAEGLVTGTSGNVSARDGDTIRITPSRVAYTRMRASDLVTLDLRRPGAAGQASIEWQLHTAIYRRRPEVRAIVHAHGAWATAWTCLDKPVVPELEEASYYGTGTLRTVPYAPSGSPELAEAAADTLRGDSGVLLARHGLVAVGETLDVALAVAESVEHQCRVAWLVRVASLAPLQLAPMR